MTSSFLVSLILKVHLRGQWKVTKGFSVAHCSHLNIVHYPHSSITVETYHHAMQNWEGAMKKNKLCHATGAQTTSKGIFKIIQV